MNSFLSNTALTIAMAVVVLFCSPQSASSDSPWSSSGVTVVEQSPLSLTVSYKPNILRFDTVERNGVKELRPVIEGAYYEGDSITLRIPIAVPAPNGFELSNISISYNRNDIADRALNRKHTQPVRVRYAGIARNKHIAHIIFSAGYAADAQIFVYEKIFAKIQFTKTPERIASKPEVAMTALLNSEQSKYWTIKNIHTPINKRRTDKNEQLLESSALPTLKITIGEEGIQRITAEQIAAAGINISPLEISSIKIYGMAGRTLSEQVDATMYSMNEQPLLVRTKSNGDLQDIIFYGSLTQGFDLASNGEFRHFTNPYSSNSSYLLVYDDGVMGKRMETLPPAESQSIKPISTYTMHIFGEDELTNPFNFGSGRDWFGRTVDPSLPLTITNVLHDLDRSGVVQYRFVVAHRNSKDGTFGVTESGKQLVSSVLLSGTNPSGTAYNYIEAVSSGIRTASLPASSIAPDNRSALQFSYRNSVSTASQGNLDWYEILYPRQLVPINNSIEIFTNADDTDAVEYTVNGFNGEIFGIDVTNRLVPSLLVNSSTTGGMFIVRHNAEKNKPRRWILSSRLLSPILSKESPISLKQTQYNAEIVVITHRNLLPSAEAYKQYRESQGKEKVVVIATDDIYREFSAGMQDVSAIRNFLAHANVTWEVKPRYVLLWGDGHFDYKNIIHNSTNFIPPYQTPTSSTVYDAVSSSCVEDYFACIVGNDVIPDMAVSRITVSSNEIGNQVVEKIRQYERESSPGTWRNTIALVADDGPTSAQSSDGNQHTNQSEELSQESVPEYMQRKKIYLVDFPTENVANGRRKPGVTQQILSTVNNDGVLIMNWVGHGSPRLWANELVFEKDVHLPLFVNKDKPFLLTAATCDFARFDDASRQSGAEDLVVKPEGGAIAVFASSRAVYSDRNFQITTEFYKHLFSRDNQGEFLRLGDIMYRVKLDYYVDNDRKFLLLGDPAMRILLPQYRIRIDSINGVSLRDGGGAIMPNLQAQSQVQLSGSILPPTGEHVDSTFDGNAYIALYDSENTVSITDLSDRIYPNTVFSVNRQGSLLNRSAWNIEKGRFSSEFVIPRDISFSDAKGLVQVYAVSSDNKRHAVGSTKNFTIGGIAGGGFTDNKGPEIEIFLDSRRFRIGDNVRNSPVIIADLFDETGVNTTGAGIGRNIEARIDGGAPINLTDSYTAASGDSRRGSVQQQVYDLSLGRHMISMRAWDVLNNVSETQTFFTVLSPNSFVAENLWSYPNPSSGAVTWVFTHNQSQLFDAEIHIFAADGRLVRKFTSKISEFSQASFVWDGKDTNGNDVSQGHYYCFVNISTADGETVTTSGGTTIIR